MSKHPLALSFLVSSLGLLAQDANPKHETRVEASRFIPAPLKATAARPAAILNDPKAPMPLPDEPTRGATSTLRVRNDTAWFIEVRVDGRLLGVVSPNSALEGVFLSGDTRLEAVAEFTDGSKRAWGPRETWVNGTYGWTLVK